MTRAKARVFFLKDTFENGRNRPSKSLKTKSPGIAGAFVVLRVFRVFRVLRVFRVFRVFRDPHFIVIFGTDSRNPDGYITKPSMFFFITAMLCRE
jgi:hypothetical protein